MTLNIEMEYESLLSFDYQEIAKSVAEEALDFEGCPFGCLSRWIFPAG